MRLHLKTILSLTLIGGLCGDAAAQSDPSLFDTVINVPAVAAPDSIDDGTQLNLGEGGSLPRGFRSAAGSEVNISGGTADDFFFSGGVLNVTGGTIDPFFRVESGSVVNISGGTIGPFVEARSGSTVNVSGGVIGRGFDALGGSVVNISGGRFGDGFSNSSGTNVTISGGMFGRDVAILGEFFSSNVTFIGGEFSLNGQAFAGDQISVEDGDVFTGTFADGSVFIFSDQFRNGSLEGFNDDQLRGVVSLQRVDLPAIDTTPATFNSNSVSTPFGLRTGQTLTVENRSLPENFEAVDATVNLNNARLLDAATFQGGSLNVSRFSSVGNGLLTNGATVVVDGGFIAGGFSANFASDVIISNEGVVRSLAITSSSVDISSGGSIGDIFLDSSTLNLTEGTIGGIGVSEAIDSTLNISGGEVVGRFSLAEGSVVNFSGGDLGDDFRAQTGSTVNVFGTEFFLDGGNTAIFLEPGQTIEIEDRGSTLTGLLADGSDFEIILDPTIFNGPGFSRNAILRLTSTAVAVPEPAHTSVLLLGILSLLSRRKRKPLQA